MQREEALKQSQEISLNFDSTQSEVRGADKMYSTWDQLSHYPTCALLLYITL